MLFDGNAIHVDAERTRVLTFLMRSRWVVEHLKPTGVGVLLATLNMLVIAIGLTLQVDDRQIGGAFFFTVIGFVPAVVLGALLGWLAGTMGPLPVWLRRSVLCVPAVLLVILLAVGFTMQDFILVACIPTAVTAFVLEHATRVPPAVPFAQARRDGVRHKLYKLVSESRTDTCAPCD